MTIIGQVSPEDGEECQLVQEEENLVSDVQPVLVGDAQAPMQEDVIRLQRASDAMLLPDGDTAFGDVQCDVSRQLQQVDVTDSIQESSRMLQDMLNSDLLEDQLYRPMKAITDKVLQVVDNIEPGEDVELVKEKLDAAREIQKFGQEQCQQALEDVYKCLERQMSQYCGAVRNRNKMMGDAFTQVLEMYQERIDAEVNSRGKLLAMKQKEHTALIEASRQMNKLRLESSKVAAEVAERQLATEAKKEALLDERKRKDIERQAKKDKDRLELERQREQQQHDKEVKEMVRQSAKVRGDIEQARKRDEAAHDKSVKELDLQAKRGKIDQLMRATLQQELQVEMGRYNQELKMAEQAIQAALRDSRRSFRISHTAPKIEFGPPPRVVPGGVSWSLRG